MKEMLSSFERKFFEDEDHAVGGYISKKELKEKLLPLLTTAITEAWKEAQAWDEEAVPFKAVTKLPHDLLNHADEWYELIKKYGWQESREALLSAQEESRK